MNDLLIIILRDIYSLRVETTGIVYKLVIVILYRDKHTQTHKCVCACARARVFSNSERVDHFPDNFSSTECHLNRTIAEILTNPDFHEQIYKYSIGYFQHRV